jgi:hypothetical protein
MAWGWNSAVRLDIGRDSQSPISGHFNPKSRFYHPLTSDDREIFEVSRDYTTSFKFTECDHYHLKTDVSKQDPTRTHLPES